MNSINKKYFAFQHHGFARIWLGESVTFLLGEGTRRFAGQTVYGRVLLWVRVYGTERTFGDNTAHRQDLPHTHTGKYTTRSFLYLFLLRSTVL